MEYLVSGGAGFIGSHLVEHLTTQCNARVRVLDNFSTGKRDNLAPFMDRVELIDGDMRDPAVCRRACANVRVVFHLAALPSVPKSVENPVDSHDVNINGTFNLLLAARDARAARFIYAGSSSAYGETQTLPKVETIPPSPLSPYAVNKLLGEYYCRVFAECYGLSTVTLRYFNVFGPRQDPNSQYAAAIPAFVTRILRDEPPTIYGDGEQTRDFTFIENVVHGNMLAAKAEGLRGEVLNVACGESITVNQIIGRINTVLGKLIKPVHVAARKGDIKHSWADISAATRLLGYRPVVSFDEGLRRSI